MTVDLAQDMTPGRVVAVVGAQPFRMRSALRNCGTGVRAVTNSRWREGMAGSLRRGLEALPSDATAALILLSDQPLVTANDLEGLVAAWSRQPQRAAAAGYGGRLGIPAILPRRLWRDAKRASGDVGAREILRRPGARITTVSLPAAGVDIDTERDLEALRA